MENIENNIIFTRRSIRSFIKEKKVENEKVELILKAAMQAPSACNKQPWEFLVLDDANIIESIAPIDKHYALAVKAPLVIIAMGNEKTSYKGDNGMPWFPLDVSAAVQNMLLEAASLGLGSVWIGTYPDEKRIKGLQNHFNIPEHIIPFAVIAIGYSEDSNKFVDRFVKEKVHYNKY